MAEVAILTVWTWECVCGHFIKTFERDSCFNLGNKHLDECPIEWDGDWPPTPIKRTWAFNVVGDVDRTIVKDVRQLAPERQQPPWLTGAACTSVR